MRCFEGGFIKNPNKLLNIQIYLKTEMSEVLQS